MKSDNTGVFVPNQDDGGKIYCYGCMRLREPNEKICPVCGYQHLSRKALEPGTMLQNGKYILGKTIGSSFGSFVYIALNTESGEKNAIKQFDYQGYYKDFDDKEWNNLMNYFVREAELLEEIKGISGVVQIKDFFYEMNTAFIVENYINGHALFTRDKLESLASYLYALYPVLDTLDEVHKKNVIHCDIVPRHILVENNGCKSLVDFGSALKTGEWVDRSHLKTTQPLWTSELDWFPPELDGFVDPVGPWTDVFEICGMIFSRFRKSNHPVLEVLQKGMSSNIRDRFQSMSELKDELEKAVPESIRD